MEKLLDLTYSYDALEPTIGKETMEIHHSKHLNAYVTNFNNAVAGTKYESMELIDILKDIDNVDPKIAAAVRNNGGGIMNHNMFFSILKKDVTLKEGAFKEDIITTFGSVEELISKLQTAGATRFGSGWAALVLNQGKLEVISTPNQDNPVMQNMTPVLMIDVWEHAYYLNYQNRRPDYLKEIFNVINWDAVEQIYNDAK